MPASSRIFLWAEFRDPRFYPSSCESLPSIATIEGRSTNRGCKAGYENPDHFETSAVIFNRFTRLQTVYCVHNVIEFLSDDYPYMDVIGISGEFLLDMALIRREIGNKVLKKSVSGLVELHILKNLTVYVVAGSLGRFKSYANNIVFDEHSKNILPSSESDVGLAASSGPSVLGDKVDEECAAADPPEISDAQNNCKRCRE
ncbi:hypothetical protein HID58_047823 [Brassica napus]|uniref:Uncharacterized protein n=1 Tax=Brassica napus TaxID=3708 RepID=A0ABQ8B1V3_BRANA|nr:hypothetical protein HID58_047823 [Brassica napus]